MSMLCAPPCVVQSRERSEHTANLRSQQHRNGEEMTLMSLRLRNLRGYNPQPIEHNICKILSPCHRNTFPMGGSNANVTSTAQFEGVQTAFLSPIA